MKKFIVFIITAIILVVSTSFTAKAQFVGGETTTDKLEQTILMWDGFNKSFSLSSNGYFYTNITSSPTKTADGGVSSMILNLSLGKTKEDCIKTLSAYKDLINSMDKNEWREITDVATNISYKVVKDGKSRITLTGGTTEKDKVVIHNTGALSISDIDKMIGKL